MPASAPPPEFVRAEQALLQALRAWPGDADAVFRLGLLYQDHGRSDDALDCYRRTIAARPDHAEALVSLGVALAQRGQLAEATGLLVRAVAADPGFALLEVAPYIFTSCA